MRQNVKDWERVASIAAGLALVAVAAGSRRGRGATRAAGLGLVARGVTGLCPVNAALGRTRDRDTKRALSGPRGIRLQGGVTIHRPAEEVFDFWRDLRNLPLFVSHLEFISLIDEQRSHWVMSGPAGLIVEWDAEIINERRPEVIAWRSVGAADVVSAGSVRFRRMPGHSTEVRVLMQYEPPAGRLGAAFASLAGAAPESMMREDLRRLKEWLESGASGPARRATGRAFTSYD
jgi:uncharacterized membrane protein